MVKKAEKVVKKAEKVVTEGLEKFEKKRKDYERRKRLALDDYYKQITKTIQFIERCKETNTTKLQTQIEQLVVTIRNQIQYSKKASEKDTNEQNLTIIEEIAIMVRDISRVLKSLNMLEGNLMELQYEISQNVPLTSTDKLNELVYQFNEQVVELLKQIETSDEQIETSDEQTETSGETSDEHLVVVKTDITELSNLLKDLQEKHNNIANTF